MSQGFILTRLGGGGENLLLIHSYSHAINSRLDWEWVGGVGGGGGGGGGGESNDLCI